jgi:hypothetical protein
MKYLIILLAISNAYAQDIFDFPNPVNNLFKDTGVKQEKKNGKTTFSFFKNKKKGKYTINCFSGNGQPIEKYSNIEAGKVESLVFYYDLYTLDKKIIRVPSDKCFIEENLN